MHNIQVVKSEEKKEIVLENNQENKNLTKK